MSKHAKLLLIAKDVNIGSKQVKDMLEPAEVAFHGLKLVKNNVPTKVFDRVGTMLAKSEIEKVCRRYHSSEIMEVVPE